METHIVPMLSVSRGAEAIDFYKRAFGAEETFRVTAPDGAVVAELAVAGAPFMVADGSLELGSPSPDTVGGTTVRIGLHVPDPDGMAARAVAAGARLVFPVEDREYGWRQGRVVDPYGHHWMIGRPLP